jgi:hypothetical protein
MRRFHLILGLVVFIVFAVTGRFMRIDFPDKEIIPQELRILMRSRHIYIVFSSLMHLLLGLYVVPARKKLPRSIQYAGSAVLTASSFLLISGFVVETYRYATFSDISRFGIYAALAGTIFHLVGRASDAGRDGSRL